MAKKKRIKANAVPAPTSRDAAEKLLGEIGSLQRELSRTEAEMNDKLAAIRETYEKTAQVFNEQISEKFEALHIWAEANRSVLLKGKAKTAKLSTGEISWRITPPSVRITGVEAVIERLKTAGLHDLVRMKEEVNRENILADTDRVTGIKGIKITKKEEFVAKPYESLIERAVPSSASIRKAG